MRRALGGYGEQMLIITGFLNCTDLSCYMLQARVTHQVLQNLWV